MSKWKEETRHGSVIGATMRTNKLRINIHHHVHYEPELWLLSVSDLISCRELKGKTLDEAKCQGLSIVQAMLEEELSAISNPTPHSR